MSSATYSFCNNCHFSSFCAAEEENAHGADLMVKQHRHLKPRDHLCLPKNTFKSLYAVKSGALKAYQTGVDGKELIRGFYFAGEIFGYEAIYTKHYPYSAIALTETVICEIPYDNFLTLLHSKPILQKHLLYLMSQQLNVGSYLAMFTAEQRLSAFLIDLSHRLFPGKQLSELVLPMSRQDIGNYLKLTAETVSRVFSRFKKNKLIAIDHKKIHLLQREKLTQLAEVGI